MLNTLSGKSILLSIAAELCIWISLSSQQVFVSLQSNINAGTAPFKFYNFASLRVRRNHLFALLAFMHHCKLSVPWVLNHCGAFRKGKCSPHPHDIFCNRVWLLSFVSASISCLYWLKGLLDVFISAHRACMSGWAPLFSVTRKARVAYSGIRLIILHLLC